MMTVSRNALFAMTVACMASSAEAVRSVAAAQGFLQGGLSLKGKGGKAFCFGLVFMLVIIVLYYYWEDILSLIKPEVSDTKATPVAVSEVAVSEVSERIFAEEGNAHPIRPYFESPAPGSEGTTTNTIHGNIRHDDEVGRVMDTSRVKTRAPQHEPTIAVRVPATPEQEAYAQVLKEEMTKDLENNPKERQPDESPVWDEMYLRFDHWNARLQSAKNAGEITEESWEELLNDVLYEAYMGPIDW